MSIENILERIAVALEKLAGSDQFGPLPTTEATPAIPVAEQPKRTRAKKAEPVAAPVEDAIPGADAPTDVFVPPTTTPAMTGAELRNLAQKYITAAGAKDADGKQLLVNKLVTFIQSVAKIFNPAEPKLIKIPDAQVPEAAKMISDWCTKNHLSLPVEV